MNIEIEVAYARSELQSVIQLKVDHGTTVLQAIEESNICSIYPEIELEKSQIGIYGRIVRDPATTLVFPGQRIEIYRPLLADPKELRRLRARS